MEGDERFAATMNRPLHSSLSPPIITRYETKFYEWQALGHVANLLNLPVLTNVRQVRPGSSHFQSPEIDGMIHDDGKIILIEVKSFNLAQGDIDLILKKYSRFEYEKLLIVAPHYQCRTDPPANVSLLSFVPDFSVIQKTYLQQEYRLPDALQEELSSGDHHFRFMLPSRSSNQVSAFRNQVDKKIKSVAAVLREIRREAHLSNFPLRVFWSVSRWLFPKELFFSSYRNHLISRGIVFDIDGSVIHNPLSPCELRPGQSFCTHCVRAAKRDTVRLLGLLHSKGRENVQVVFSGRQGFHVYVLGEELRETEIEGLLRDISAEHISIDTKLARDPKAVVTFPGSVHALTMLTATPVTNIETYEPN
jgi:hypothetical protein